MSTVRRAKHDGRAIAALLAVFALLVQALIPSAAMAARANDGSVICTATGTHALGDLTRPSDTGKTLGGMPCQDCLAAAMAMVMASPVIAAQPVAYEVARVEHGAATSLPAPRARAPPRPLGQGPPTA
jgi:hypothetical protein